MSEVYTKIAHIYTNTGKEVKVVDSTGRIIHEASRLITVTGIPPISFTKSIGKPLVSWDLLGNAQQTGTPSPDNIIMPDFCGVRTENLFDSLAKNTNNGYIQTGYLRSNGSEVTANGYHASEYIAVSPNQSYTLVYGSSLNAPSVCFYDSSKNFISGVAYGGRQTVPFTTPQNAAFLRLSSTSRGFEQTMLNTGSTTLSYEPYGYKIPITCAGQTTPVYLGQVNTVRRVKKLVLTGKEDWKVRTENFYTFINTSPGVPFSPAICTHAKNISVNNTGFALWIKKEVFPDASTIADFKSYLAAQYAAGTPVTVWYALATPETGIVNEPLAKIGDYADELHSTDAGVTIPTVKGDNTLTVDTDLQPSSMTIVYKGKP